jgi:hypothetical protein
MNTQPQQRLSVTGIAAIFGIAAVVAGIVLAALALGALWALIGGVVALGVISVALARVGVSLFSRYTDAALKRDTLRFGHIETVMKMGYLPEARNVRYVPMPQLEAPADVPVSLAGITNEQLAEFKIHAVNLLALSKQEMGENSGQVLPFYRAKENDYFRDVAVWTNAVRFLIANRIAVEQYKDGKQGRRKVGTFLVAGSVGQAFDNLNRP